MKHLRSVGTFAVCLAIVIGCGEAPPSDLKTTPTARSNVKDKTASPTPSATSAMPTTTRPWKVTLERSDSCRIVRAISPKRFNSSQGKVYSSESIHFPGNVGCGRLSGHREADPFWDDPGIMLNVIAVVDQGADDFIASPRIEQLIDQRIDVDGFRAFVLRSPDPGICQGLVDVAGGQFVFVWLAQPYYSEGKIVVPRAKLCNAVPGVLSAALDVLESTGA